MEWDEESAFPKQLLLKMAELGFLGVIFPEECGGSGLGYVEFAIVIEELARVDPSVALSVVAHHSLCTNHIFLFGTEEQRKKYVVPLAQGEKLGCWSLTEPEAGSDAGGTRTVAEHRQDGWLLNGSKTFVTNAHYADTCVVMAVTDRERGHHGISAFIVEKENEGFRLGKKENKLGMRASPTSEVILENCRLKQDGLLGREGEGLVNSLRVLDGGRIGLSALAVGLARGAFDNSLQYAKQRKQFGRTIGTFQAIQWKLATMKTEIEAARWLTCAAAYRADNGGADTKLSAMTKLYSSEIAVRASGEAVQIHGGYGFIKDYPAEKFYRDVKLCTIGEGTSEIQRLVIARELLGKVQERP
jgi:alkylation response protein AidB-like acyl-CoA dehydrogenase